MNKKLIIPLAFILLVIVGLAVGIRPELTQFASAIGKNKGEPPALPSVPGNSDQNGAELDLSEIDKDYISLRWTGGETGGARVLIQSPDGTTYVYALRTDGEWQRYLLTGAKGSYYVGVYGKDDSGIFSTALSTYVSAN